MESAATGAVSDAGGVNSKTKYIAHWLFTWCSTTMIAYRVRKSPRCLITIYHIYTFR
ncbi:hypothetical protein CGCVW01_v014242 [Colletotrichum viniferum]|nr:hypothetical protein CGCVW01_v014242 [Colletotrichum viniferum]